MQTLVPAHSTWRTLTASDSLVAICRVDALKDCVPDHTRQADKIKDLAAKYENMVFMQATDDQMYYKLLA